MTSDPSDAHSAAFAELETRLRFRAELTFKGLRVEVRTESPEQISWMRRYLAPFFANAKFQGEDGRQVGYRVDMNHSDEVLGWAARCVADVGSHESVRMKSRKTAACIELPDGSILLFDSTDGAVFVIDQTRRHIRTICSSRTSWPGRVVVGTVREILVRYIENEGWNVLHAGAVATAQGVILVIGEGGSGKTSLIAGLVRCGASFVANERCFVRSTGGTVAAMPFPQIVNVGIGTAEQFPALAPLVANPGFLTHPQRRLDGRRIARTPPEQRSSLPDKISLLPGEFSDLLGGSAPIEGGRVIGIVEPDLDLDASVATFFKHDRESLAALVSGNWMRRGDDRSYPNWLGLEYLNSPEPIDDLFALAAIGITFRLSDECICGLHDPVDMILGRLALVRSDV